MSINRVTLVGYLGADPEMHRFEDGNCVARLSLATNTRYTSRSGEKVEQTQWHAVIVRGRLAELVNEQVKKGSKLYVEGELRYRIYEDPAQVKHRVNEVMAFRCEFLPSAPAKIEEEPIARPVPKWPPVTEGDEITEE